MSRFGLVPRGVREALRGAALSNESPVPAPGGSPGRATAETLGFEDPGPSFVLYAIGDSGGVEVPTPQLAVAQAMVKYSKSPATEPAFVWHVGDEVYFGGEDWGSQFYEPYAALRCPILGIPGNHDDPRGGDPPVPSVAEVPPLASWMSNMCSTYAHAPAADPQDEYGRDTVTQPYCDWTLRLAGLTVVGAWSNVPSGGRLSDAQVAWMTSEVKAAPTDRPLVVSIHHPPLSVDAHHGGSQRMFDALTRVFEDAGRVPALCLFGHVHDYQRFTWNVAGGTTTAIVIGNSGYHNLHPIAGDYVPGLEVEPGVVCEYADARHYGFLALTVAPSGLRGQYVAVTPGTMPNGQDPSWTVAESFAA